MSGKNFATVILQKVRELLGLDLNYLVGQGYDGAACMSSVRLGASAEVLRSAPFALYFHCAMHLLNLCATETARIFSINSQLP